MKIYVTTHSPEELEIVTLSTLNANAQEVMNNGTFHKT
jgi:hypothetical protein